MTLPLFFEAEQKGRDHLLSPTPLGFVSVPSELQNLLRYKLMLPWLLRVLSRGNPNVAVSFIVDQP
jgi:hypothetical protein